jgi:integrase
VIDIEKEAKQAFLPVLDSRRRKVKGLYLRGDTYYGSVWCALENGSKSARRFRLLDPEDQPVKDLNAAKEALEILRNRRREGTLPSPGHKPSFEKWSHEYESLATTKLKNQSTQGKEGAILKKWRGFLGGVRLDRITTPIIKSYCEDRLRGLTLAGKTYKPCSVRTIKIDLIVLNNVLKAAIEAGHLTALPRLPRYKAPPAPVRELVSPAEFELLLEKCTARKEDGEPVTKNGIQLRDLFRVLAYAGGREKETLALRWNHVDFKGRQLWIGAPADFDASKKSIGKGGSSKNREARAVDFNPQLEEALREMHSRKAPDTEWMFPSPQRGSKDLQASSLRESMIRARKAAGLVKFGFHHLRDYFISYGVMAGIDFMTIAKWAGHKDGGVLIGKVYGHLADDHRRKMADKLVIGISSTSPLKLAALS